MFRQPRLDAPGVLHHVMRRGIERTRIFRNDQDREDFLNTRPLCLRISHFYDIFDFSKISHYGDYTISLTKFDTLIRINFQKDTPLERAGLCPRSR